MFKPVTEKEFKREVLIYMMISLINLPILLMEWSSISQWYAQAFILFFGGGLTYNLLMCVRILLDKTFARRRFIYRNDERNLDIQDKCLRNVAMLSLSLAGGSYGYVVGSTASSVGPVMVDLLPLAVSLTGLMMLTYYVSWGYYRWKL